MFLADHSVTQMQVGGSIGLFSLMTMGAFIIIVPFALIFEGAAFLPSTMKSLGVCSVPQLVKHATIAAFTFHMYQQVSYMILARVSPVTHSIGNCVKRYGQNLCCVAPCVDVWGIFYFPENASPPSRLVFGLCSPNVDYACDYSTHCT